jgi:hypothetical protein
MLLSPWGPSLSCDPYSSDFHSAAKPFWQTGPTDAGLTAVPPGERAKTLLTKRPLKNIIKRKKAIKIEN